MKSVNSLNSFNKIKYNLSKEILNKYENLYEEDTRDISLKEFLVKNTSRIIEESGLFDDKWYLEEYPDVAYLPWTPLEHYLKLGVQQKCNPNSFFDSDWYLQTYPTVQSEELNPLFHFIVYGINHGYFSSFEDYKLNSKTDNSLFNSAIKIIKELNLFDESYYLEHYPDVEKSDIDAFTHYLKYGYKEGRNPSAYFNTEFYLEHYPDVYNMDMNPLIHYALYGRNEGRLARNELNLYNKWSNQTNSKFTSKNFYRAIENIKKFNLFDNDYYLRINDDVLKEGMNPLTHYLLYGFSEKRNPSPLFNTNYYLERHHDVKLANMNPLIHYALYGIRENRSTNPDDIKIKNYDFFSDTQVNTICQNYDKTVSIIVYVSDQYEQVRNCLDSIIDNTDNYELIVIGNFNSFENELKSYDNLLNEKNINFNLINNINPLKLSEYLNKYVMSSDKDIVLLKSNVIVTPGWLGKLKINAYSDYNIATVTPLSNSMDLIENIEETTYYLTLNGLSRLIERASFHINMNVAMCNSPCLFVKKEAINKIGLFDEELIDFQSIISDFCLKSFNKNWLNIVDDSTYIFIDKEDNTKQHDLPEEHLDIKNSIKKVKESFEYKLFHDNLIHVVDDVNTDLNKIRILYVIQGSKDNVWNIVETHNHLISQLANIESYLLKTTDYGLVLYKEVDNKQIEIKEWNIGESTKTYDKLYRKIYFNILYNLNVDLIQIDSLINQSYDLPFLANLMNIPLILTINDYYYINPLTTNKAFSVDNRDEFLSNWYVKSQKLLKSPSIIITSNNNLSKIYQKRFPSIKTKFKTIPQVYTFNKAENNIVKPKEYLDKNRSVKILILGLVPSHYYDLIHGINELDVNNQIEFHFIGDLNVSLKNEGIFHSVYDNFDEIIQKVSPSIICLLSDENSTNLSMAYSYGIPVITLDKQVNDQFELNGVTIIDEISSQNLYNEIIDMFDEDKYNDLIERNDLVSFDNLKMVNDFKDIYREITGDNIYLLQSVRDLKDDLNNGANNFNDFKDFTSKLCINPMIQYPLNNDEKKFLNLTNLIKESLKKQTFNKPLVSVIMPIYNRERIMDRAITSVLNQTYSNFELLIIDDASTDNTLDSLISYDDSRINIFSNDVNKGASYSRNVGLKNAKGKYIFYLDSDNTWQKDYLETMVASYYRLPDADAVYCGQYLYTQFDDSVPYAIRYGSMNRSMLCNSNYIDLNCFSHKKEIISDLKGFDETLNSLIDWDFIIRLSLSYKIYAIPVILSNYYSNNAINRITDVSVYDESFGAVKNNIVSYIHDYGYVPMNQNKDLIIIIPNVDSNDLLVKCLNSSSVFRRDNVRIIVLYNENMSLTYEQYDEYNISFIERDLSKNFSKNMFNLFNTIDIDSDVVILNSLALLEDTTLDILQEYAYKLDNSGILIPQQIIEANNKLMSKFMPYSTSTFPCDIALSSHNTKIVNMSLYNSGECYELSVAPFFCMYVKRELMENIKEVNLSDTDNSYDFIGILSSYVYEFTNYSIYYVSNARAYYNMRGQ